MFMNSTNFKHIAKHIPSLKIAEKMHFFSQNFYTITPKKEIHFNVFLSSQIHCLILMYLILLSRSKKKMHLFMLSNTILSLKQQTYFKTRKIHDRWKAFEKIFHAVQVPFL